MNIPRIVEMFVAAINAHEVDVLASLMTEDHRFMDSLGNVATGRETMRAGWASLFLDGAGLPGGVHPALSIRGG